MSVESLSSTAQRTLRLVELLLAQPDGLTPQEMLLQLGVSRSTLFVLLKTLKSMGYIEQFERRGRYRCGPRLTAWRRPHDDHQQALMTAFFQETARQSWPETLLLTTPTSNGLLVLAQNEGSQRVRCVFNNGETTTALAAANQIFDPNPAKPIRANGYALAHSAHTYELALPICPDGSRPQAALAFCMPSFRWEEKALLEEWLPVLRAMAARLSYRLGALTYTPYQHSPRRDLPTAAPLTPEDIHAFLQGPWTARLACLRSDGKPHVIPVWQEWDGQNFTLIAWQGSQWVDFVTQNPEVSLTIDEPWPPLRRVTARGKALPLKLTPKALRQLVTRLSQRYLGEVEGGGVTGPLQGAYRVQIESLRGWQGLPGSYANDEVSNPKDES
jgi:DNA-binding IclR family transcriptional regulator